MVQISNRWKAYQGFESLSLRKYYLFVYDHQLVVLMIVFPEQEPNLHSALMMLRLK